ncbi:MAG: EAL domain-containing protein [Acidimicrobiia bacterium]
MLSVVLVGALALGAVAVGVTLHGREQSRDWRRAWWLLGGGLLGLISASFVEAISGPGPASFPSAADPLTLLGQILAVGALVVLVRHRLPNRALDLLFEAGILAVALGFAICSLAIVPGGGPGGAGDHVKVLATVFPLLDLACLWLIGRVLLLSHEHPVAYRYLVGAFLCLCTVHAVTAGGVLQNWSPPRGGLNALTLWSYCLWGAGALHPSLRQRFDPVPSRPTGKAGHHRLVLVVGALLVGPAVLAVQAVRGQLLHPWIVFPAAMLMPACIAAHLLYQVRERAGAEYRAQHDPLTGLPNQVLFRDRVNVALARADRHGTGFAVMFLDLDRFKDVNDSLGHAVGNQLLQAVANRLQRTLRAEDTVARMGGDEFTLLVAEVADARDCQVVADKVRRVFSEPFLVGSRELFVSTSIGIAVSPADGTDFDTLLKNADTAMYRAKAKGRNTSHFYTPAMSAKAQVKHALEGSLRAAIDRHELLLHYQPKVDLTQRSVVGLEALVRWNHSKLGILSPGAFIPLAEETGLIVPLGDWVLESACRQIRRWLDAGLAPIPVAVNLSARQFEHHRIENVVARLLEEYGVDGRLLEVELTESVFHQDVQATRATLHSLRALGVRCAIDDFGTGFSGLQYLAEMPIDSLKIDQSFVQKILRETDEAPIVGAVIALAHNLGMNVVAEGVETEEQARFLTAHGCEQMQGFLFSKPLPVGEIEQVVFVDSEEEMHAGPPGRAAGGFKLYTPPRALASDQVGSLLYALGSDDDHGTFEPGQVAALLAALQTEDRLVPVGERMWRSASVRLAAGTFAGLMPISSGLAAAGALPAPAQQLVSSVLAQANVTVPTPDRSGQLGFRTESGQVRPGRGGTPQSGPGHHPSGREDPDAKGGPKVPPGQPDAGPDKDKPGRKDRDPGSDNGPQSPGKPTDPGKKEADQGNREPGGEDPIGDKGKADHDRDSSESGEKKKSKPEHPLGSPPGNADPGVHPEHPRGAAPGTTN